MKNLLILGAGTAGTMMVNKLHKALDPAEWTLTIVDKDKDHYYQPGFLFVPFQIYDAERLVRPKRDFIPDGVPFVVAEVEEIEPEANDGEADRRAAAGLRRAHRRHRHDAAARGDARLGRRAVVPRRLRLLHLRGRVRAPRPPRDVGGRPARALPRREHLQVPHRPARIRLPRRLVLRGARDARPRRDHLRHPALGRVHEAEGDRLPQRADGREGDHRRPRFLRRARR